MLPNVYAFINLYFSLRGLVIALFFSMGLLLLMRCCVSVVVIILIVGVLSVGAFGRCVNIHSAVLADADLLTCRFVLYVIGIYQCHQEYRKTLTSQLTFGDLRPQSKLTDYLKVKELWLTCCKYFLCFYSTL